MDFEEFIFGFLMVTLGIGVLFLIIFGIVVTFKNITDDTTTIEGTYYNNCIIVDNKVYCRIEVNK